MLKHINIGFKPRTILEQPQWNAGYDISFPMILNGKTVECRISHFSEGAIKGIRVRFPDTTCYEERFTSWDKKSPLETLSQFIKDVVQMYMGEVLYACECSDLVTSLINGQCQACSEKSIVFIASDKCYACLQTLPIVFKCCAGSDLCENCAILWRDKCNGEVHCMICSDTSANPQWNKVKKLKLEKLGKVRKVRKLKEEQKLKLEDEPNISEWQEDIAMASVLQYLESQMRGSAGALESERKSATALVGALAGAEKGEKRPNKPEMPSIYERVAKRLCAQEVFGREMEQEAWALAKETDHRNYTLEHVLKETTRNQRSKTRRGRILNHVHAPKLRTIQPDLITRS